MSENDRFAEIRKSEYAELLSKVTSPDQDLRIHVFASRKAHIEGGQTTFPPMPIEDFIALARDRLANEPPEHENVMRIATGRIGVIATILEELAGRVTPESGAGTTANEELARLALDLSKYLLETPSEPDF